jgi:hypothetical protein
MKPEPFYNKTIEHRLALKLSEQPQSNNHKRGVTVEGFTAYILAVTVAIAAVWTVFHLLDK